MKNSLKKTTDQAITAASGVASQMAGTIGRLGKQVSSHLSLPGLQKRGSQRRRSKPGASPGIESIAGLDQPPALGTVQVQCVDYSADRVETRTVENLAKFLKEPRPDWVRSRWINVDGLHPFVVNQLRETFDIHTLAAEDVLNTPQRPKIEEFENHLFIVVRMLMLRDERLTNEQVSLFLSKDTLLTIQESRGDVWDPIRQRLQKPGSRLRNMDITYLLYALLDAVVDHCFPILESYGELLDQLETEILENPGPRVQQKLLAIKRDLALLRRVLWPLREVVNHLQRDETEEIPREVKAFMRDVYDHAVQVMDIVETYREMAGGLNDLYMSSVGNRMNEIMKVLTIMASFFIPITFVAGVYGMNFEYIPELGWKYSYAVFWAICATVVGVLLLYFRRKGWLGGK
jgi:magnesium transporter